MFILKHTHTLVSHTLTNTHPYIHLYNKSSPEKVGQLFQKLMDDKELLKSKQKALMMVRPDLVYGYGSPLDPDSNFKSRIADHLLKEALIVSS